VRSNTFFVSTTSLAHPESNPGQGQVAYKSIVACTRPLTSTDALAPNRKENAVVVFKEYRRL